MVKRRKIGKKPLLKLFKRKSQNAIELGQQADEQIEKLLLRRFDRLMSVKRFVFLWVLFFISLGLVMLYQIRALSTYYQALLPAPGGVYNEGVIGTFSNANPLYSSGTVDNSVSRLIFSSLFSYDKNDSLVGDLATGYSLSADQAHYTVSLRKDIAWQDGKPFSADDVVFTYSTIKDISSQSPLYNNWKDVNIAKVNDYTVKFDLPNPVSSFPYSMTNGIVPKHLLSATSPSKLRSAPFNTNPVGTGPFKWQYLQVTGEVGVDREEHISMVANKKYFGGKPKLEGINITSYLDDKQVLKAYTDKKINAVAGLELIPASLQNDKTTVIHQTPLASAMMAFFKNSNPILSDVKVRQALVSAVDRTQFDNIANSPVKLVDSPLLRGRLGYDPHNVQLSYDLARANKLLDEDGWVKGQNGFRVKNGQTLELNLHSQSSDLYTLISQYLQSEWTKIGIKINIQYYDSADMQSNIIPNHDYDILVYTINMGPDPDVFAYWDSTQASTTSQGRLNLSEYKSSVSDQALESARTRSDATLRSAKYAPFLSAWAGDAPALGLFQPNFLYVSRGQVFNYGAREFNIPADRLNNVASWQIRQSRQTVK